MSDDRAGHDGRAELPDDRSIDPAATAPWIEASPLRDAPLPPDVARGLGQLLGAPVESFADFASAVGNATADGSLAVADLCHAAGETPHRATVDGEEYRFRCFYDGLVLAHLADEPAEIRTESPEGDRIEIHASPDGGVDVTPSGAAVSFGVAADAPASADDGPAPADLYGAVCPYVRAFPDREAYERWAADTDAATVGVPLAAGASFAPTLAR